MFFFLTSFYIIMNVAIKKVIKTLVLWYFYDQMFILCHKKQEQLIHSKTNTWVQQNYDYDSFLKRSNET